MLAEAGIIENKIKSVGIVSAQGWDIPHHPNSLFVPTNMSSMLGEFALIEVVNKHNIAPILINTSFSSKDEPII